MRILAVDLSLTATGLAWSRKTVDAYAVYSPKQRGMERMALIVDYVMESADACDVVVLEGPSLHSQGSGTCERWGLRGALLLAFWRSDKAFIEIPPARLKKYATGKGNANKDAMIAAAIRTFGYPGSDNNGADAWLLLQMARDHYEQRPQSKDRTAVVAAIEWPYEK